MHWDPQRRLTILLFGGSGQLGWELQRCFAPLGIVVPASNAQGRVDLSDAAAVRESIAQARPNLIVNAAAYTAVDRAEEERELAYSVNATAPEIMAQAAAQLGATLLHYSTDYVFAGDDAVPREPGDPVAPCNYYGATKLAGEDAIRRSGCDHLILRTSWLYAPRGINFLLTMLRLIDAQRPLTIVSDQIGSPTPARAVADLSAQLIAQACSHDAHWWQARLGTYHVTTSGQCSWYDFAQEIVRVCHPETYVPGVVPITSSEYPTAARRPRFSLLSGASLRAKFGVALPEWTECFASVAAELGVTKPYPWIP
ncbi:MAG: dTDP-4-dehydrorhamnose reductase [Gammaproteobacteria bacterium]|nr:dTDP-4-dehydrorhamnose reductase [Gammaproteobacteria bacterium]